MVTHDFLSEWFPLQPKSCDMSPVSVLTSILNMVTKLQSEGAFLRDIFSKTVILPSHIPSVQLTHQIFQNIYSRPAALASTTEVEVSKLNFMFLLL